MCVHRSDESSSKRLVLVQSSSSFTTTFRRSGLATRTQYICSTKTSLWGDVCKKISTGLLRVGTYI